MKRGHENRGIQISEYTAASRKIVSAKNTFGAVFVAGRPSKFNQTIGEEICRRLARGESLVKICETDGMAEITTVFRWLKENEEFRDMHTLAKEARADFYVSQIIDIADETPVSERPGADGEVTLRVDPAGIQRNKLRVDARKWVVAKLSPKTYGMQSEVRGERRMTWEELVAGSYKVKAEEEDPTRMEEADSLKI